MNSIPDAGAKKIYAVWSRKHSTENMAGRDKVVANIKKALECFPSKNATVQSTLEKHGAFSLLRIALTYIWFRLRGRQISIQLLLFNDSHEFDRVLSEAAEFCPDVFLIDTVRLIAITKRIRATFPEARIVLDMDDLMSRRYAELAASNRPIALGYLEKLLPEKLRRALSPKWISRIIYFGEAAGLGAAEEEVASVVDKVVLGSQFEAAMLQNRLQPAKSPHVVVIPPPASQIRPSIEAIVPPVRFISVGSDRLLQNAETIRYLLRIWKHYRLTHPLVIYGHMTHAWGRQENVIFPGFASHLTQIYTSNSVLLTPSFVKGGVKTKVVEAFGFGIPVIGNSTTFEGLNIDYPLNFSKSSELETFIKNFDLQDSRLAAAQLAGYEFVTKHCSLSVSQARWHTVLVN